MPEWSIGPHSKCGVGATLPGVRIPLFPQPAAPPTGGLLLSKGKPRSPTLRADRGKQKRSSEAARCGLLVPPPGMYKRVARRQPSFSATRNAPHWGAFALEGMSSGRMKARNAWKNSENTRPAEPPHPFEPHLNPSMIGQFGTYPRSKDRLNPCPNPFGRHVP